MRTLTPVVAMIVVLVAVPSFALAQDVASTSVPVSTLVIASGGLIVSALLALLAWSLKNNVEGFKVAMMQALDTSNKATAKADHCSAEIAGLRLQMAGGLKRDDVDRMAAALQTMSTQLTQVASDVRILMHEHEQRERARP
jgi:outer membrane murein-binding lipoprotein Lpp